MNNDSQHGRPRRKAKEAEYIKLPNWPEPCQKRRFVMYVRRQVSVSSAYPHEAMRWMLEAERATAWQQLPVIESFEQLSIKLLDALMKIMPTEERRRLEVLEQQ